MAVTDNFNRANGGLGANWTTDSAFSALTIVSNVCKGGTGGVHNVSVYTTAGTAPANQYAQCKVAVTGGYIGTVLRSNGAGTFYACYYPPSSGLSPTIYKIVAGSFTDISSGNSAITIAVNDIIYFEAAGTALTMKVNGVTVCTATDSVITGAGYTGIDIYDNTAAAVDDFEATSVAADVTVNLTGVAADPQIGSGTVTIGSAPVEPPVDTGGGGTGSGRRSRGGMRLRPAEDIRLFLDGVAANPRVGRGTLVDLKSAYKRLAYPMPHVALPPVPIRTMPWMRKKAEAPPPPAVIVYSAHGPQAMPRVGSGKVTAHFEEIDEEVIAMIDAL